MVDRTIREEICKLGRHFRENELAFLLLTGKSEILLRDRLAFSLQEKLDPQGFEVRREYHRADLAVLDSQQKPAALIQFKMMVTFDCTEVHSNPTQYPELMCEDLRKVRKRAKGRTDLYSILFATHPLNKVPEKGSVKYARKINEALLEYENAKKVLAECNRTIKAFFRARGLSVSLCAILAAGEYSRVKVRAPCWILGPLKKTQLPRR